MTAWPDSQPRVCHIRVTRKRLAILAGVFLGGGVLLLLGAIIMPHVIDQQVDSGLKEQFVVTKHEGKAWDQWYFNGKPDDAKVYKQFWVFHVTNPTEVENEGVMPKLKELGPFSYREYRKKINVDFFTENGPDGRVHAMANYTEYTWYEFDEATSGAGLKETDEVTVANVPFAAVMGLLESMPSLVQKAVEALMKGIDNERPFTTRQVHQLFWGYEDPLLVKAYDAIHALPAFLRKLVPKDMVKSAGTKVAQFQVNHTSEADAVKLAGVNTIFTGETDPKLLNIFQSFKSSRTIANWNSPELVGGTNAINFPYPLVEGANLPILIPDIFRVSFFEKLGEYECMGIKLWRYEGQPSDLYNATEFPYNSKYNQFGPEGVFNLTAQPPYAPVFLSHAHFLDAPAYGKPWWDAPEGEGVYLPPTAEEQHEKYGAWIGVEPITGATMDAHKRLQINIPLKPSPYYPKVPKLMMPVTWIEETATLNDYLAHQYKSQVGLATTMRKVIVYGGYPGGVLCLITGVVCLLVRRRLAADEKFEADEGLLKNASDISGGDHPYTQMANDHPEDPEEVRRKSFSLNNQSSA